MNTQSIVRVTTDSHGVIGRRNFLKTVAAGSAVLGFRDAVALGADKLRKKGMACILLWMNGGPSQFETFDPKPGTKTGGPTKAIDTAVSGIQVAEHWPLVAKQAKDIAFLRSLTNKEGAHQRAVYQLHTGFAPSGAIKYPAFGSVVAAELGDPSFDLPNFVSVGTAARSVGSGFLGAKYAPFGVSDPSRLPGNVSLPSGVSAGRFGRRLELMKDLEADFADAGAAALVRDHGAIYENAARMVTSPRLGAFDISQEPKKVQEMYGRTGFGQGCLLARRLIETGVTFVEVESNGWDTHLDNFERVKSLAESVDKGFAALIADLKDRGMLERTLVVWMGEFGRTPRINAQTGRDHYPVAFNGAVAGGGIKGGQVIGATNSEGTSIKSRPISVPDLFCTLCQALGINPRKENLGPLDRPIKIVDGGEPVKELF